MASPCADKKSKANKQTAWQRERGNSGKAKSNSAAELTRIFLRFSEFFMLQRLFTAGIGSNAKVCTAKNAGKLK